MGWPKMDGRKQHLLKRFCSRDRTIIFETAEEFVAHSGKKVLSVEEIKQRLIERALTKLTDEEKQALGY